MTISSHYPAFEGKTLVVITNNQQARLLNAFQREIDELEVVAPTPIGETDRANDRDIDLDHMKAHELTELYSMLNHRLLDLVTKHGYNHIVLCVPEVNKGLLMDSLHPDVKKAVQDVVPKNLASMDLGNIVRILLEG